MKPVKVISSTIGQASASPVTLSGGYRYRGDQNWPQDRSAWTRDQPPPGVVPADTRGSTERKRERLERFAAALADLGRDPWTATGPDVIEAGRRAGVGYDTARGYRAELRKRSVRGGKVQDS